MTQHWNILSLVASILLLASCSTTLPTFNPADQPAAPDYSKPDHWSALPFRDDAADVVPYGETWVSDSLKDVDVFYIYPTLYSKGQQWNADLADTKLNKRLDNLPVRLQAGVFAQVGRVYAPRYRQSHVDAFWVDRENGEKALSFAYQDVKQAFEYYMQHYNQGRPIIIASHSQGTWHARRLLKDYFDDPEKKQQLVCAYIVGYAVYPDKYEHLKLCEQPTETECYVTWSSFETGYTYPEADNDLLTGQAQVNPITWTTDTTAATTQGSILLSPAKKRTWQTTAHIHGTYLWVDTHLPFMRHRNNLHVVDYNLFWHNIRENAQLRVKSFGER